MAELADAPGLGPGVQYGREGSNPFARSSFSGENSGKTIHDFELSVRFDCGDGSSAT